MFLLVLLNFLFHLESKTGKKKIELVPVGPRRQLLEVHQVSLLHISGILDGFVW